jgi:hypothetical protein
MHDTDTTPTQEERDEAARTFLDDPDADSETYDDCSYSDHLILTDEEADERTAESIRQSAWAFNASFLVGYLPEGVGTEVIEALQPQCEGANDAILAMIGERFDEFVADAISADGRGHFLAGYDGNENEFTHAGRDWYAYRN